MPIVLKLIDDELKNVTQAFQLNAFIPLTVTLKLLRDYCLTATKKSPPDYRHSHKIIKCFAYEYIYELFKLIKV